MQRLLRRTTHQINEQEASWTGFLADANSGSASQVLRGVLNATTHDGRSIVREAWSKCRTIVTTNGSDFLRHFQGFQDPPSERECRDLWSLLVIPSDLTNSKKQLEAISEGLPILPKERLHWPALGFLNLYIHLTDKGELEIRRFKRCLFCESCLVINSPWDEWYEALPLV